MSGLEQSIRLEMARLVGTSPLPPSVRRLAEDHAARQSRHRTRRVGYVAVAGLVAVLLVGGVALIAPTRDMGTVDQDTASNVLVERLDLDGDGIVDLVEQPPIALELPTTVNVALPIATTDSRLYAAFADGLEGPLGIVALDTPNGSPRRVLEAGPTGIPVAIVASDQSIVALVSRHLQGLPPVAMSSDDDGQTWTELELPDPEGADEAHRFATGVALGNGTIVISSARGVWVSSDRVRWDHIDIAGPGRQLTTLAWDGARFVAGGGQADTTVSTRSGDRDLAIWRSTDGLSWTIPEIVPTEPAIRTADGIDTIVARPGRPTLTLTTAQRWNGDRPAEELWGTLVTVSDGETASSSVHLPQWIFHDAETTPWGFITAAQVTGDPSQLRLLASTDGISWHDLAPAPAVMMNAATWRGGLVVNGYASEGLPNRTWHLSGEPASNPTTPGPDPTDPTVPTPSTATTTP